MLEENLCKSMKKMPLFIDLDEKDFLHIIEGTKKTTLKAGEVLFSQHQPAKEFFFIVKGQIKVSILSFEGQEKVIDIIRQGNTFAEAIIFRGMDGYPVNGTALTDATILKINAKNYIDILHKSTEACFKVIANVSARTHWLMQEVERLSLHNASYRLITFLLENIDENSQGKNEVILTAPKHIIASRLSVTPETFSRTLKNLSKQNLLKVHENHIVLYFPDKLRKIISI